MRTLFGEGAGLNLPEEDGDTPLMFAVKLDHIQCVNAMIKAGADLNAVDIRGNSIITSPIINGIQPKYVDLLIKAGVNVNQPNESGKTPLMRAASYGLPDTLNMLLTAGADVNTRDKSNISALDFAALHSYSESVETLVKAGADVNNIDTLGDTSLLGAVRYYDDEKSEKEHHSHLETVKILINAGVNMNIQNNRGKTALLYVVRRGHVKSMEYLLAAGADVNISDNDGVTALIEASRYGHYECLDILLKAGADVNSKTNDNVTALHLGFYMYDEYNPHYVRCIKRLLRAGIHINQYHDSEIYFNNDYQSSSNNAFGGHLNDDLDFPDFEYPDVLMLLYAAGETLEGADVNIDKIPEQLKFEEEKLQLKHICREAIRKHLLKMDPHQHLFGRIPRLGLPSSMTDYLLFEMSLDNDDNDAEGDNDSDDNDENDE